MLTNYLKIALRNLRKNKMFSLINIGGLSISVTFCILLFLHIRHEQSFDTFHVKKDRLFRLEMTNLWARSEDTPKEHFFSFLTKKHEIKNGLVFPMVTPTEMEKALPEIASAITFKNEGQHFFSVGDQIFKEENVYGAGKDFFNSFSFPLIEGNAATALERPENIVLSESTARKYFGKSPALGKTIAAAGDDKQLFTVSAVAKDAPENSSIRFDAIFPLAKPTAEELVAVDRFNSLSHPIIVELKPGVDPVKFEAKMNQWVTNYFTIPFFKSYGEYYKDHDAGKMRWTLRPLTECHYNASSPWGHYTNAKNIYQLSCLVIIIMLIAALNYVLLAVSNGAARSQEIGVRKVMGARRKVVIMQFWVETQVIVIIAVIIGLIFAQVLVPFFNEMIGTHLKFSDFYMPANLLGILVLTLLLGLIAGYYPALFLSRMKPVSILKSNQTFKINPRFSRILVVSQYAVCIILMMAAFVISLQMKYISNKDLGFDKEQVLLVQNQTYDREYTKQIHDRLQHYSETEPSIVSFSAITGGFDGGGNRNGFKLNGEQQWLRQMDVDYSYFKLLGLPIIRGRSFSPQISDDSSRKVRPSVVNESLFKMLGPDAKIGVYNEAIRSTIIGVVKDYHFDNLAKKIEPQQHTLLRGYVRYFLFRMKPGNTQQTIAKIESAWKKATDTYPFEYTFLDQNIASMYEAEMRWQTIIRVSCIFAIIIACLGLFGLSSINTTNRTKEIGIRKLLGADVAHLVSKLSVGFLGMACMALLIAIPVSVWLMNKWLQDFEYRIQLSWWMYLTIAGISLLIAFIAVGYQALKAAIANPVKSLRAE